MVSAVKVLVLVTINMMSAVNVLVWANAWVNTSAVKVLVCVALRMTSTVKVFV